jgi:hypothetical protein
MATQKKKTVTFSVDRIEGDRVILERDDDEGGYIERPLASMRGVREGAIVRVPMVGTRLNWAGAMMDRAKAATRASMGGERMAQMRERGGRRSIADRMYPEM